MAEEACQCSSRLMPRGRCKHLPAFRAEGTNVHVEYLARVVQVALLSHNLLLLPWDMLRMAGE